MSAILVSSIFVGVSAPVHPQSTSSPRDCWNEPAVGGLQQLLAAMCSAVSCQAWPNDITAFNCSRELLTAMCSAVSCQL